MLAAFTPNFTSTYNAQANCSAQFSNKKQVQHFNSLTALSNTLKPEIETGKMTTADAIWKYEDWTLGVRVNGVVYVKNNYGGMTYNPNNNEGSCYLGHNTPSYFYIFNEDEIKLLLAQANSILAGNVPTAE